ncbi:MAG: LpxI family protein [Planctomycetota bacterium]|jgi:DUF1009 family protein
MQTSSDSHTQATPIGLVAGQGQLPLLVATGIRAGGHRVCAVGLRDQYDARLPGMCDEFGAAGMAQPGRWIRLLRRFGVERAIMVGGVTKAQMHHPLRILQHLPDWRAIDLWYRRLRHDRRNAAVLSAVADTLSRSGITLIDSTTFIQDHLADEGDLTSNRPTALQREDITFAWPVLCQAVALDIGQSMAVRERDVIAVEALEGTDRMIDRAGDLCRRKGWTLLKTASPAHDMRADVPTVGEQTIERLAAAGGGCLALGAGRVILVDRPKVIAAAERLGVAIVGLAPRPTAGT